MSLFFGALLTLIGTVTLGIAVWLAWIGSPADTSLIDTFVLLGVGLGLIYRWFSKRRRRYDY